MPNKILPFTSESADPDANPQTPRDPQFERKLASVLAALPREPASRDFTDRVIVRIGAASAGRHRWRSLAAAAAFFTVASVGAREWNERLERQASADRLASLRAEYHLLQEELDALQRAADRQRPVVFLGASGDAEFVVDLTRLATDVARHDTKQPQLSE